jgi:hypothetical protein
VQPDAAAAARASAVKSIPSSDVASEQPETNAATETADKADIIILCIDCHAPFQFVFLFP